VPGVAGEVCADLDVPVPVGQEALAERGDGRYQKIYEKSPKTPCRRPYESPEVSEAGKEELTRRKSACDPAVLNSRLNCAVGRLLKINREEDKVKQPFDQGQVRPKRSDFG
jgi:hypothetical protein